MTAYIGYSNIVKSGVVTATSEAAGYEKENIQSWKTSTWWKAAASGVVYLYVDAGSSVSCDSWGVAGHNLNDNSATIKPQYSATGAWAGEELDFDTVQTPGNATVFRKVTSRSARYWRYETNSIGAASLIANLFLGLALSLEQGIPVGFSPANFNRDRKIFNNKSEGGNFLGRSLRYKGAEIQIQQKNVSRTWMDANWIALADHVELYPFYFIWSQENFSEEAAYCMANKIEYPDYSSVSRLDFTLDCGAIYDI